MLGSAPRRISGNPKVTSCVARQTSAMPRNSMSPPCTAPVATYDGHRARDQRLVQGAKLAQGIVHGRGAKRQRREIPARAGGTNHIALGRPVVVHSDKQAAQQHHSQHCALDINHQGTALDSHAQVRVGVLSFRERRFGAEVCILQRNPYRGERCTKWSHKFEEQFGAWQHLKHSLGGRLLLGDLNLADLGKQRLGGARQRS
jgi:hypothetical protein